MLVGLGGSATNDGGAGMAQALGVRLLDERGGRSPTAARPLALAASTPPGSIAVCPSVTFVAATDVDNPLTGPRGAARVFGPQKGASPDDVVLLDRALAHLRGGRPARPRRRPPRRCPAPARRVASGSV